MTDAGGIVGTISLALQVMQGLKWYYSQFTAYGDDIASVVTRIGLIEDNLGLLDTVVQRLKRDDDAITAAVQTSIAACGDAMHRLKTYQEKCGDPEFSADTAKKKALLFKKRVLYPLRKDTMKDIEKQLDRLVENLQIIMQALQLDTTTRFHDHTKTKLSATHNAFLLVHRQQTSQTELLEHVGETTERHSAQFSQHASRVESMMHASGAQITAVSDIADQTFALVAQIFEQIIPQTGRPPPPTILGDACDAYLATHQTVQETIQKVHDEHTFNRSPASQNLLSYLVCSCPKKVRRRLPPPSPHWFSAFRINESKHLPGCPFELPSQKAVIVGLRLRACWGALGYLVDANLKWSNKSLSPKIASRNIVSHKNPAFFLMRAFRRYVEQYVCGPQNRVEIRIQHAVTVVVESVRNLLRENRIGVLDVDSNGTSILHSFMNALGWCLGELARNEEYLDHRYLHLDTFQTAIQFFCEIGYDVNLRNIFAGTPMDFFLEGLSMNAGSDQSWRIRLSGKLAHVPTLRSFEYSFKPSSDVWYLAILQHQTYAIFHSQEAFKDGYDDEELASAILRRSNAELRGCLEKPTETIGNEDAMSSLYMAANWFSGLQLLLEQDFAKKALQANFGFSALDMAISFNNVGCVDILAHHLDFLTHVSWARAIFQADKRIVERIALALHKKFRSTKVDRMQHETERISPDINYDTLFHEAFMRVETAETLVNAGFTDVDINALELGTPIWQHTSTLASPRSLPLISWLHSRGARLDCIHPLYKTGPLHLIAERIAYLSIQTPSLWWTKLEIRMWDGFMLEYVPDWPSRDWPSRDLVLSLSDYEAESIDDEESEDDNGDEYGDEYDEGGEHDNEDDYEEASSNKANNEHNNPDTEGNSEDGISTKDKKEIRYYSLLTSVFESQSRDDCICHCAVGGCNLTSSALKVVGSDYNVSVQTVHRRKQALRLVLKFCSDSRYHGEVFRSALRSMTFDVLGLTHTCHDHGHAPYRCFPKLPSSEDEIRDIQYTEAKDLSLLEELLHEFESAWDAAEGEFLDFIDGYWMTRMKEILAEKGQQRVDEVEILKEIGVDVRAYGPELPIKLEKRYRLDEWEKFERRVQAIMDGNRPEDDWLFRQEYGFIG